MNLNQGREILANAVQAVVPPSVPVVWENRDTFDLGTDQRMHVRVEMVYRMGDQRSLGDTIVVRYSGHLALLVCSKEGSGTANSMKLASDLCAALQMKDILTLHTKVAIPQKSQRAQGWHIFPVAVPFWFDDYVELAH